MPRVFILCILVILLSSCGIFKKKTVQKTEIENSQSEETRIEVREEATKDVISVVDKQSGSITILEGENIKVSPDGFITASKGVARQSRTDSSKAVVSEKSKVTYSDNYDKSLKAVVKEKTKETESKPDAWGGMMMWIGIALGIFVLIWLLRKTI